MALRVASDSCSPKLPAGSTTIQQVTITGGTIHYPGMVQWYKDGKYLAVGDRRCDTPRTTCIYHVRIKNTKKGPTGRIIGRTKFQTYNGHAICDMAQGTIGASGLKFLAGGDDESSCTVPRPVSTAGLTQPGVRRQTTTTISITFFHSARRSAVK